MTKNSIVNLINCDVQANGQRKWSDFVDGGDGFLYGIPSKSRRVTKYNPVDKSMKKIGLDLGDDAWKYNKGIRAKNGSIYCLPQLDRYNNAKYILKITPNDGGDAKVEVLYDRPLPEEGNDLWLEGALASDGCIYYMPYNARRILKLDPENDDSLSLVGDDFGEEDDKYNGAIAGTDGFIYGLPNNRTLQIIKFQPADNSISNVGDAFDEREYFRGGVLANDGNIYAANHYGQVLKIDTVSNDYKFIGDRKHNKNNAGWGHPVLGADKNVYWPPCNHDQVLKVDVISQEVLLIGESLGFDDMKWYGGSNAVDGFIYFIPYNAYQVLQVDTSKSIKKPSQWQKITEEVMEQIIKEKLKEIIKINMQEDVQKAMKGKMKELMLELTQDKIQEMMKENMEKALKEVVKDIMKADM